MRSKVQISISGKNSCACNLDPAFVDVNTSNFVLATFSPLTGKQVFLRKRRSKLCGLVGLGLLYIYIYA